MRTRFPAAIELGEGWAHGTSPHYCCNFLRIYNYFQKSEIKKKDKASSIPKDRVEMFILISPRASKAFITNLICFHKGMCVSGSVSVCVWAHTYTLLHMHRYIYK